MTINALKINLLKNNIPEPYIRAYFTAFETRTSKKVLTKEQVNKITIELKRKKNHLHFLLFNGFTIFEYFENPQPIKTLKQWDQNGYRYEISLISKPGNKRKKKFALTQFEIIDSFFGLNANGRILKDEVTASMDGYEAMEKASEAIIKNIRDAILPKIRQTQLMQRLKNYWENTPHSHYQSAIF